MIAKPPGGGPRLKPPVRVRPGALLRERTGWALGARAVDELYRVATVMSEGRREGDVYYGTTLIDIDLVRAMGSLVQGPEDAALLARVQDAVAGSVRVRLRAMRLAEEEVARRFPDRVVGTARTETRFRIEGTHLYVDVDLEAPIGGSSTAVGS
ncbi:MAG: hypothetical protein U0234_07620 [Sandaracinus sp.]